MTNPFPHFQCLTLHSVTGVDSRYPVPVQEEEPRTEPISAGHELTHVAFGEAQCATSGSGVTRPTCYLHTTHPREAAELSRGRQAQRRMVEEWQEEVVDLCRDRLEHACK